MLAVKQMWLKGHGSWAVPIRVGYRVRPKLFKRVKLPEEPLNVLELYSLYLEFQTLFGD